MITGGLIFWRRAKHLRDNPERTDIMTDEGKPTSLEMRSIDVNPPVKWRAVNTVMADQILGFAAADGIFRITFGEVVFEPGAETPTLRPVVALAMGASGIDRTVEALVALQKQMRGIEDQE